MSVGQTHILPEPAEYQGRGPRPKPLAELFWAKVNVRGPDQCWLWKGKRSTCGYGEFSHRENGVVVVRKASRVAYQLHHHVDIVSQTVLVCHSCDNPPCCNPAHLFLGKVKHNVRDSMDKGRSLLGKLNPNSRLTEVDVRWIRLLGGVLSTPVRARMFDVSPTQIRNIDKKRQWKDASL